MAGGDFSVSGLPWLQAGEERVLSPKNLVANCLCSKHNSALHPLDDAALLFFENLNSLLEGDDQKPHLLVSGHDIERWLLKTAKAMAVSRSFSIGRERFLGDFLPGNSVLKLLDTCEAWPDRVGLYGVMKSGDDFLNHRRFQMQPYFDGDAIVALGVSILGLRFALVLNPDSEGVVEMLIGSKYRPERIVVEHPHMTGWITMSWVDAGQHEAMTLRHVRNIQKISR